jgi:hypothetical protein
MRRCFLRPPFGVEYGWGSLQIVVLRPKILAIAMRNLLATARLYILVIARRNKRAVARWSAYGGTERKACGITEHPSRTPEGRAARLSVGRTQPSSSRSTLEAWVPAVSDERLAYFLQPWCTDRRQHAMVRVLLGILRSILLRAFRRRLASLAGTVPATARGEYHYSVPGHCL